MSPWLDALLRWMHVLAGVLWLGQLWFASFVEARAGAHVTGPGAAESRARAVHWLRWGAAYTWVSGLLLMGVVYYSTLDNLVRREVRFAFKYGLTTEFMLATNEPVVTHGTGVWISLASLAAAVVVYEAVWKIVRRHERTGAALSLALLGAGLFALGRVFTGRAVFLHAGAILATIMAANVWGRIWPSQRRALRAGDALASGADASSAVARQRTRHNAYLSVPVLFAMISNHYPTLYDREDGWAILLGVVLAAWVAVWALQERSGRAAPESSSPALSTTHAPRSADGEA